MKTLFLEQKASLYKSEYVTFGIQLRATSSSHSGILSLSKMDWNNDALYDPIPVTLEYAKVLAQVVKRMDVLGTTPYQFRFFM